MAHAELIENLLAHPAAIAEVPLFVLALLLMRGLPGAQRILSRAP